MQINPINRQWVHQYIFEPYLQGARLIDIFWKGEKPSLLPTPLSLSERAICLIQGICLMLPFVNTIVWLAWQAFGSPEKYFDPFCPEEDPPPPPPPEVIVHGQAAEPPPVIAIPQDAERVEPTEFFGFHEKKQDDELETAWKIEHYQEMIVAQQHCDKFSSTSLYRPNYTLREYQYEMGPKKVTLSQRGAEGTTVQVAIHDGGVLQVEKKFELPEKLPLIQQRHIGFRPFVLSNERELFFYAIVPEIPLIDKLPTWLIEHPPFLMKVSAKKIGEEEIAGLGKLLKIEVVSTWRWPYNTAKSELWFDMGTGILKKFVDTGTFIPKKTGEIVQNNQ